MRLMKGQVDALSPAAGVSAGDISTGSNANWSGITRGESEPDKREPTLKNIARELVAHVRRSVTVDWALRESAQTQIRVFVRGILRKIRLSLDRRVRLPTYSITVLMSNNWENAPSHVHWK